MNLYILSKQICINQKLIYILRLFQLNINWLFILKIIFDLLIFLSHQFHLKNILFKLELSITFSKRLIKKSAKIQKIE